MPETDRTHGKSNWPGYALLAAGAMLALGFLLGHSHSERSHGDQQALLMTAGKELSEHFNADLQHAIDIIESTTWLFYASHQVDRDEFLRFTDNARRANQNIRRLAWSPRVTDAERSGFVAKVREQALPGFDLFEDKLDTGKRVAAAKRGEYFPLLYTNPSRDSDLGFDTYSVTDHRWAMNAALEHRRPYASIDPVGIQGERTMTIHAPVFMLTETTDETLKESNLVGYVTGVVTLDGLLKKLAMRADQMNVDVLLFDSTNKTQQLLAYLPSKQSAVTAEEAATQYRILRTGFVLPVDVAGRKWEFVMQPRQGGFGNDERYLWMLLVALLLTGAVAVWMTRLRIARAVSEASRL